jgi:hypothetical protein
LAIFQILGQAMRASKVAILTSCTSRKRHSNKLQLVISDRPGQSLKQLAGTWASRVGEAEPEHRAGDYYLGRAFSEARHSAHAARAKLLVVSAGLGLVDSEEEVPPYDLTVAPGASSLLPLLRSRNTTTKDWWRTLGAANGHAHPISSFVSAFKHGLVLIALPATYLEMIAEDLETIPGPVSSAIRIISSPRGQALVPAPLQPSVLAYDERLEGSPFAGTRSDFPQRALNHFVVALNGHRLSLEQSHRAVASSLKKMARPAIPTRQRKSDKEIAALLMEHWDSYGGHSSHLLRFLRDEALVACEQSRFRDIWRSVEAKYGA